MSIDAELIRHQQNWHSFTRFLKWGTGTVVVILILLAWFLL